MKKKKKICRKNKKKKERRKPRKPRETVYQHSFVQRFKSPNSNCFVKKPGKCLFWDICGSNLIIGRQGGEAQT